MSFSVPNKNGTKLTKSQLSAQSPLFLLFCAIRRPWGEFKNEVESEEAEAGWESAGLSEREIFPRFTDTLLPISLSLLVNDTKQQQSASWPT